jgi:type II secretory ATPase GspE/PulE/Tfp pilus assembly ATPase PilB-like protein
VPEETLNKLGLSPDQTYWRGRGCDECNGTGYRGRLGLFEMLPVTKRISKMITSGADEGELLKAAQEEGFVSLREDGLRKVSEGVTTPEEVIANTME